MKPNTIIKELKFNCSLEVKSRQGVARYQPFYFKNITPLLTKQAWKRV